MNDFTKEELMDLFNCCKAAYISGEIDPQKPLQIKHKLQFMIDSYCEHERDEMHPPVIGETLGCHIIKFKYKCVKCGEFYDNQ